MTRFKTCIFLAAASVFALHAAAQSDDRSYVADYANSKASVFMIEGGARVDMTLNSVEAKELIFTYSDGRAGQLAVPKDSDIYKFEFKVSDAFNIARSAYNQGDWNNTVANLRAIAYPLIPLAALPEKSINIQPVLDMFLDSLLNADRINEAYSFVKAMPLNSLSDSLYLRVLDTVEKLARANKVSEGFDILNGITVDTSNFERNSKFMDALAALRKRDGEKQALVWYTRLGNDESNTLRDLSTLWMIYCDLTQGNKMSAQVYLSRFDEMKAEAAEFSLLKLVQGMLHLYEAKDLGETLKPMENEEDKKPVEKAIAEKKSDALFMFAEGIANGRINAEWMPELLFRAGIIYKEMENFKASNGIFAQIIAVYPDDIFAAKSKPQMVKIEEKKPEEK